MADPRRERFRTRGLDKLVRRVGDVCAEIETRLSHVATVAVLEVGCGHGAALMGLRRRYGGRVELHGINKEPGHGDLEAVKAVSVKRGLYSDTEARTVALPALHYFDVCDAWPLPADSFDVIYSQHAFLWFADKVRVLEEIHRALKPDGVALLDLQVKRNGPIGRHSIIIQEGGRRASFWSHARRFDNLRVHEGDASWLDRALRRVRRTLGLAAGLAENRSYLEVRKGATLDFNLTLCSATRFSTLIPGRKGVQSLYRVRSESPDERVKDAKAAALRETKGPAGESRTWR